jgi:anthranilate phosphoribosyltransferase
MFVPQEFRPELGLLPAPGTAEALANLYGGEDLSIAEAETLFTALIAGALSEPEVAGVLTALKVKGETEHELIGAARALRKATLPFPRPDYPFADCCGTGGDGSGSINVSTAVTFVAAAAGLPVAKHGNRSFSSRCGSADVLEELGARLDVEPEQSRKILDEVGVCFLYAPIYHPGLAHAGPARRALRVRTIMNLLGPCLNPARPSVQLLGVADPKFLTPIAQTLAALGVEQALIVHGSGLDELALHGPSMANWLSRGEIEPIILSPEDAGLTRAPLNLIKGGDATQNAGRLVKLLNGNASPAETDLVALNAGALLMTAGKAESLREGVVQAADAIFSGAAAKCLDQFIEATNG